MDRMIKKFYIAVICFIMINGAALGQDAILTGTVADTEGQVMQFVNLAVKGTSGGATTGKDGRFGIPVPAGKEVTILFSFVGYETDSIVVNLRPGERKEVSLKMKQT